MMNIENTTQLDFNDILIKPKRSTLNSRNEVSITRNFSKFKWYNKSLECIPICSANMATTGTIEIAKILSKNKYLCALHKFYTDKELETLTLEERNFCFKSVGLNEELTLPEGFLGFNFDIPNGYIPKCIDRVKEIRQKYGNDIIIIAGTVISSSMTEDLILAGADVIRVGIGGGCFHGNMKVLTDNGLKQIKNIEENDKVLTHTGKYERVINKFIYNSHNEIIDINGIKCTPNHKFYVINKNDISKVTETNYKDYCVWIEAKDLNPSIHKLIKIIN